MLTSLGGLGVPALKVGLQEGTVHEGFIAEVALEKGGKSQQRDCDLQKWVLPASPALQTKLCCFKVKGETAHDVGCWRYIDGGC